MTQASDADDIHIRSQPTPPSFLLLGHCQQSARACFPIARLGRQRVEAGQREPALGAKEKQPCLLSFAELLRPRIESQALSVGPAFSSRGSTTEGAHSLGERQDWAAAVWPRAIRIDVSQTSGLPEAAVIRQL